MAMAYFDSVIAAFWDLFECRAKRSLKIPTSQNQQFHSAQLPKGIFVFYISLPVVWNNMLNIPQKITKPR
jgi:hypothetical protein